MSIHTKALVVNGDDMGINHSHNAGVVDCVKNGIMTTAGIMAAANWAPEAVALGKEHGIPIGIHLMLTCEYDNFHVGPITRNTQLCRDQQGMCFVKDAGELGSELIPDIITELSAQIDYLQNTLDHKITHLEEHMGCIPYWDGRFAEVVKILSRKYDIRFHTPNADKFCTADCLIPVDHYLKVVGDNIEQRTQSFVRCIEDMQAGLHWYCAHVVDKPEETNAACGNTMSCDGDSRFVDFSMLCHPAVKAAIVEHDIQLMNASEAIAAFT
ncbi:MAG: ChbG/HpnK family deacetylase [Planctomycetes bacterium]|nr:ChbG/HpnK family deacetylase [Planctomycetota bacterium]